MTVRHAKDMILFRLNTVEMRQVMEEPGMICSIWKHLAADTDRAAGAGRWIPRQVPLKICHEQLGRGHVLQCRVDLWPYFREVEAASPLEREIRAEMMATGLSGEADRRITRHAPT